MLRHRWQDISGHYNIRLIYTEWAEDATSIPFPVRARLGDYLLLMTEQREISPVRTRRVVAEIAKHVSGDPNAYACWKEWCSLTVPWTGRRHTINTIYTVLHATMDAERRFAPLLRYQIWKNSRAPMATSRSYEGLVCAPGQDGIFPGLRNAGEDARLDDR